MSTVNADQYLAVVESELTDLPWKARKSLLADLRVHLEEIPPDEDLVERLGSLLCGIYAHCGQYDASTAEGYDSMAVRMRFLYWTHTVRVPLNYPLVIETAKTGDPCRS